VANQKRNYVSSQKRKKHDEFSVRFDACEQKRDVKERERNRSPEANCSNWGKNVVKRRHRPQSPFSGFCRTLGNDLFTRSTGHQNEHP
jgi:hypothetical protein